MLTCVRGTCIVGGCPGRQTCRIDFDAHNSSLKVILGAVIGDAKQIPTTYDAFKICSVLSSENYEAVSKTGAW
jgi:hypothetical protein